MDMKSLISWVIWFVILCVVAYAFDYVGWVHTFAMPYWYVLMAVVAYVLNWMMPISLEEAH